MAVAEREVQILALRLSAELIEPVVLGGARLALELRAMGRIAVVAEHLDGRDLVARPLSELVAEALSDISAVDELADLAEFEILLQDALAAVRAARDAAGHQGAG